MESKKQVHVVVALIWKEDCILVCQRPNHKTRGGYWEFVGGKIEDGETKQQALIRECMEELNITVNPLSIFAETQYEYPDMALKITAFIAEICAGDPVCVEHQRITWLTAQELSAYKFSEAAERIVERIIQLQVH